MELHDRLPLVAFLFTPSKVRVSLVAEPLPEKNRRLLEKLSTRHNEFCHWHLGVNRFADQLFEIIAQICRECHYKNVMRFLEGPSSTGFKFRSNSRTPFLEAQCMKTYENV